MLRWLLAIEIVLIVGVFAVIAAGLRWDFSSPLPGAMVAVSELPAGTQLTEQNIWVRRPSGGDFDAGDYDALIGRRLARPVRAGARLQRADLAVA